MAGPNVCSPTRRHGCKIRNDPDVTGYRHINTTMISTHVLNRDGNVVRRINLGLIPAAFSQQRLTYMQCFPEKVFSVVATSMCQVNSNVKMSG